MRLRAIAGMVTKGNRLADVGCDHGYLSIWLVSERTVPSAIAMDVRPGPLSRARENISRYGLEDYIETRLSDGLTKLEPGEGDTLVIAGMGGPLMERILNEGAKVREGFQELILQPQSDLPHFRHFLSEIGWEIVREEMIMYTEAEAWFGPLLLEKCHPVLKEYLLREASIRKKILADLFSGAGTSSASAKDRLAEVKEEMELIKLALGRYESI